jgi:hypothetical protein
VPLLYIREKQSKIFKSVGLGYMQTYAIKIKNHCPVPAKGTMKLCYDHFRTETIQRECFISRENVFHSKRNPNGSFKQEKGADNASVMVFARKQKHTPRNVLQLL